MQQQSLLLILCIISELETFYISKIAKPMKHWNLKCGWRREKKKIKQTLTRAKFVVGNASSRNTPFLDAIASLELVSASNWEL